MVIKDLIEKGIFKQSGYIAPEAKGAIKMDANENPISYRNLKEKAHGRNEPG